MNGRTKVLAIEVNVVTVDSERIRFEASIATLTYREVRTTPSGACDTPHHIIPVLKHLWCCHRCIQGDRSSWKPYGHKDILAWPEDVPKVAELDLTI